MKQQLSDLADSIRSKYQNLKRNEVNFQMHQEKKFKPLLTKMKENKVPNAHRDFISPNFEADDKLYGLKRVNGMWYLGSFPLCFTQSNISLGEKTYPFSTSLVSLLTKKNPQNYTQSDLNNYRNMLADTKVHLTLSGDRIKF